MIARRGTEGNEFLLVDTGKAASSIQGEKVKEYGPLDSLGEFALLERQQWPADVVAENSPTRLLVLEGDALRRLLGSLQDRSPPQVQVPAPLLPADRKSVV